MSKGVNKVFLLGNLGRDPETKQTGSGKSVSKLALATNEKFKGKDGAWQEKTEWHNVIVWESPVVQYLHKGSKIHVEGRLQTRSWEDEKSGQKKYSTEIVAEHITLCDSKPEELEKPKPVSTDDDIPF